MGIRQHLHPCAPLPHRLRRFRAEAQLRFALAATAVTAACGTETSGRESEVLSIVDLPRVDGGSAGRDAAPAPLPRYGGVNLAGAEIWVGGTSRGKSPIDAIRVPAPSRYPIEIKKAGFSPFRASVAISPDTEVNVDAELTRPGGKGAAWYSKWWVVATAGVVVAGAVTTAVILTRDADSVPVMGHF